jgi:hypothetical protein
MTVSGVRISARERAARELLGMSLDANSFLSDSKNVKMDGKETIVVFITAFVGDDCR